MYKHLVGKDSLAFSPLSLSATLAMAFLGSRGSTSWQINEVLKLDEMIVFNPHLLYKDISEAIEGDEQDDGTVSASVRQLLVDEVSLRGSG